MRRRGLMPLSWSIVFVIGAFNMPSVGFSAAPATGEKIHYVSDMCMRSEFGIQPVRRNSPNSVADKAFCDKCIRCGEVVEPERPGRSEGDFLEWHEREHKANTRVSATVSSFSLLPSRTPARKSVHASFLAFDSTSVPAQPLPDLAENQHE